MGMACAAVGYAVFTLEVLNQYGTGSHPRLPTCSCGDPTGTRDALAATAYSVLSSITPAAQ